MDRIDNECFQGICKNFLIDIDNFIAENLFKTKCSDMYDVYSKFFWDLKLFQGNSNGFTGLSEYLIFRFLYNQLGGLFKIRAKTKDLNEFISPSGRICIGQNIPVLADKKYYPDIVIYSDDTLVGVIQIKLYVTGGLKEINREMNTFEVLKEHHPHMKGLFLSFNKFPPTSKLLSKLNDESSSKDWFNFLLLDKNEDLLYKNLENDLKLTEIYSKL